MAPPQFLGAQIPHPAGLLLAGAVVAGLCSLYQLTAVTLRSEQHDWGLVLGGVLLALVLGVAGAALAGLGAPTF